MSKSKPSSSQKPSSAPLQETNWFGSSAKAEGWQTQLNAVAQRFNQAYRGETPQVSPEVESLPLFREWVTGQLQPKLASPFWALQKPRKHQHCLDLGCGVSFLIYPWTEWDAFFYGQEISTVAQAALTSRAPQLNSKLFKGVKLLPAHELDYGDQRFDLAIATGFSCYYGIEYWEQVLGAVQRVLKPEGFFLFDVLNPEAPLAEDWAILETYLGTEVFLEPLSQWELRIKAAGGKIKGQQSGELFHLYKVQFI